MVPECWGKGAGGINEWRGPGDDRGKQRGSLRQLQARALEPDWLGLDVVCRWTPLSTWYSHL